MRITRNMLENRVSEYNHSFHLGLQISYHNGYTWLYQYGEVLWVGTTGECYNVLSVFIKGFNIGIV